MDEEDEGLGFAGGRTSGLEDVENQGGGRAIQVAGCDAWGEGDGRKGFRIGVGNWWFCHGWGCAGKRVGGIGSQRMKRRKSRILEMSWYLCV